MRRSRRRRSRRPPRAPGPARRRTPEEDCGLRTPLQRDRDRIVHSKAFRRLKHKTQVFVAPEGDHYRTRLTHTLEVTQIARTVARALRLNEDLTEAIGLGHDLGHPPFGHIGEDVLDAALQERFGREFRHYEHSLRVVDVLERDGAGLNLTEDVRDGIVVPLRRARRCRARSRARIVRIVDRVAYINHDIDDALRAGRDRRAATCRRARSPCSARTGSTRIDALVHDLVEHSAQAGDIVQGDRGRRGDGRAARRHVRPRLPRPGRAHASTRGSSGCCCTLFDALRRGPEPLPDGGGAPGADDAQRVTDYLAGMTDRYCIRVVRGAHRSRVRSRA